MSGPLPRRDFLKAGSMGSAVGFPRTTGVGGAELQSRRPVTMDRACGPIGV
jgi:hypothetical protein